MKLKKTYSTVSVTTVIVCMLLYSVCLSKLNYIWLQTNPNSFTVSAIRVIVDLFPWIISIFSCSAVVWHNNEKLTSVSLAQLFRIFMVAYILLYKCCNTNFCVLYSRVNERQTKDTNMEMTNYLLGKIEVTFSLSPATQLFFEGLFHYVGKSVLFAFSCPVSVL